MTNKDQDTFCKKMRKATKEIHTISDTLVNTKLAFGFLDNSVWADGLLVFYEIFRYLELAMIRWKHTEIGLFLIDDQLLRTEAFECDLAFYLGKEWEKNYSPRDSVIKYLVHLRNIENTEPILLIAYIYHLYMGLLSGGIILRKKRQLMHKIWPFQTFQMNGNNITNFGNSNIFELKQHMRDTMNTIAEMLDDDTKTKLLEESKTVFALNNEIIKSVRGTGTVLLKRVVYFVVPVMLFIFAFFVPFKR
ncbi:Heme oxygenase 1 [Habropoda laboriosa]|uniref:Heme oxygenase n=2 Tax=Habropoda laboriosa TaxID=597456 RepID=A0A0L7RI50_9HYME|nr:Heme oxygenase 1 [Habropoda laboriosa]